MVEAECCVSARGCARRDSNEAFAVKTAINGSKVSLGNTLLSGTSEQVADFSSMRFAEAYSE